MKLVTIGAVMLHRYGTNPYHRDYKNGTGNAFDSGDERVRLLKMFRAGTLPEEYAVWNDRDKEPITDPATVDWSGLR